jgi:hypothetical protein
MGIMARLILVPFQRKEISSQQEELTVIYSYGKVLLVDKRGNVSKIKDYVKLDIELTREQFQQSNSV